MTSQERQFYIAILFNMCRYLRRDRGNVPVAAAIDHVANALRTPALEIVR